MSDEKHKRRGRLDDDTPYRQPVTKYPGPDEELRRKLREMLDEFNRRAAAIIAEHEQRGK
jgi:hypothetical protein